MLAGEMLFYNRYSGEIIHRIDCENIDINTYHHSKEFYTIIFEKRVGRVVSSIHYTNGAPVETILYQHDLSAFTDVPVEKDTRLINVTNVLFEGIEARYEAWVWEGILAETLIFHSDTVAHMSDEELESFVERNMLIKDHRKTVKRQEKYTFINFNFYVPC
jgi:hypothetical protein